jgi:hypothetical protein
MMVENVRDASARLFVFAGAVCLLQAQTASQNAADTGALAAPPMPNLEAPQPERPQIAFPFLRQEEDWSFLASGDKRSDFWDPLKYIALPCDGCYLTLGGEERIVYEYYNNAYWGIGPQTASGFVTQRYSLITDFHFGDHFRFFGELSSNLEDGRNGGPRPFDEDRLDVHQAFFDFSFSPKQKQTLIVRIGRQELFYGRGRLVDTREGPNIRFSWDGALARWQKSHWRIDGFAVRPVIDNPGIFDDVPDHTTEFWGVYASGPLGRVHNIDVYYFGIDQKSVLFNNGTGQQVRQTFGARWWGKARNIDYDDEVIDQVGTFANENIRAWAISTVHGYTFNSSRHPRFGLRADIASGDHDPYGRTLGTFDPLFPSGKYFGEADLNGPANTADILPNFSFDLTHKIRCTTFYGSFWRESVHDGMYGLGMNLQASGLNSDARFEGQEAEIDFDYPINAHALVRTVYQHFFPGEFLRQVTPGRPVNYATFWWVYRF